MKVETNAPDAFRRAMLLQGRPEEEKASDACFHEGSRLRSDESDLVVEPTLESRRGLQRKHEECNTLLRGEVRERKETDIEREVIGLRNLCIVPFDRRPSTVDHRPRVDGSVIGCILVPNKNYECL